MEAISGSGRTSPSSAMFHWQMSLSQLTERRHLSHSFTAGPCNWRIIIYPKGLDYGTPDYLSIHLMVDGVADFPTGWSIDAEYTLTLNHYSNRTKSTIEKGTRTIFSAYEGDSKGFPFKILLADLHNSTKGYPVDDTIFIEAQIFVHNSNIVTSPQSQVDESSSRTNTATETDKSGPLFYGFEDFGSYLKSEQKISDLELKKELGTHIWNKMMLDNLTKEEEKLNKKIEEIKCQRGTLLFNMSYNVGETKEKKKPAEE